MRSIVSRYCVVLAWALAICARTPQAAAQTGACCLSDVGQITCSEMLEIDCTFLGGTYGGDGSTCPTESTALMHLLSPSTALHLLPTVGCQDVGTTGPGCAGGPLVDAWITPPPTPSASTCTNFGAGPESPPIPADFFGPGSDPFIGQVCYVGGPLGPTPFGTFDIADTLILRSADPFDRCDLPGSPAPQVEIQIVELNLVSVQPIVVTFNGGQNPRAWDVRVNLSDFAPPPGTMGAIKLHCNGGQYQSFLPVQPKFTFTPVDPPQIDRVLDTGLQSYPPVQLNSPSVPWVHDLDPGVSRESQSCTEFHPGVLDPDPPPSCAAPTQVRTSLHLSSSSTQIWLDPGVTCDPTGSGGPGCVPGPLVDPWRTSPPGPGHESFHDFGTGPESPPIPAEFFGPGSEPFEGRVYWVGEPLGPTPFGDFGIADTLIVRSADPFDRCEIPSPVERTVDIEIVALSLQSVQPITVLVNDAPTYWDVTVDLSSNGSPIGGLDATKSHCNGGTYSSSLPVQPRFTFTRVGDPGDIHVLDTGDAGIPPIVFDNAGVPWVSDLDPHYDADSSSCTNFHPGIDDPTVPGGCDCQGNNVHDSCDLESGTSFDCNDNASPDECDAHALGDHDGNGVVDLGDHEAFEQCLGGPGAPPGGLPECAGLCRVIFDDDGDEDVDLRDYGRFAERLAGP